MSGFFEGLPQRSCSQGRIRFVLTGPEFRKNEPDKDIWFEFLVRFEHTSSKKLAFNWLTSCCQTWRKNFLFSFCFLQFRLVEFFQISRQCFWQVWLWLAVRWHSKEKLLIGQKFMEFPNGFHTLGKPMEFYVFVVYNLCILKLNKPKIRACGGL